MLYDLLKEHVGHRVEIAQYGDGVNFALEDLDTDAVIFDTDVYDLTAKDNDSNNGRENFYHIHFDEWDAWEPDKLTHDVFFTSSRKFYLEDLCHDINELKERMDDIDDEEMAEKYDGWGWQSKIDEALRLVSDKYGLTIINDIISFKTEIN